MFVRPLQDVEHLRIREALAHADGPVVEADVRALAFGRVVDLGRLDVTQPPFLQTRQAVGQHLRQHRDHALRQVHARPPGAGFLVELPLRVDEVRHVGDVNAEPPVAGAGVEVQADRVVEVPRVGRVDGDDQILGEVGPAVEVVLVEHFGRRPGLGQRLR